MTTTIRCDIVSAEEEIFHGEVVMVVATGEMGELGIAPRHAPLITRLKPGKLVLTLVDGSKLDMVVSGGILEVQPQVISILADTAIRAEDIDEAAVLAAKADAERVLANKDPEMSLEEAERHLAMSLAQLQALERLRKNLKH
jgi:F-type H+-transporting ATPase subunit epsilon